MNRELVDSALDPVAAWRAILATQALGPNDTAILYYSLGDLDRRLMHMEEALAGVATSHMVAIKTAPHPAILDRIVRSGHGLEAASFEEVLMAIAAGARPDHIAYNSPVKTRHELARCTTEFPGLRLNANSVEELARLPQGHSLRLGLRVNPLIDPGSRSSLFNVSGADSKFGVPIDQEAVIEESCIRHSICTLHVHVGSQSSAFTSAAQGIARVFGLARNINMRRQSAGKEHVITTVNIGGGVPFEANAQASERNMEAYAAALNKALDGAHRGFDVITEFGQWVHGNNGIAFSQVEYVRSLNGRRVAYIHLGADLFMRHVYVQPQTLAFKAMTREGVPRDGPEELHDIAGPLCFHGDFLARGVMFPVLEEGDVLAISGVAANTFGLWSRHASRALPAFFVHGGDGSSVYMATRRSHSTAEWS